MPVLTQATFGKFCREVALGLDDETTLLAEWGVDAGHWDRIRRSEAFAREMATIHREVAEQGPDAGYIFRMKALSEELIPHIVKMMDDPSVAPGIKVDLIKFCAEIGRLRPAKESATAAAAPSGPMVTFNFGPGLPVPPTIEVKHEPPALELLPHPAPSAADGDLPDLDGFPS